MKYCTGDVWVVELPWSEWNGTANWYGMVGVAQVTTGSKSPKPEARVGFVLLFVLGWIVCVHRRAGSWWPKWGLFASDIEMPNNIR